MRHYDIANRSRRSSLAQFDFLPNEAWALSLSAGVGQDDYDDSYFGLQEASFELISFGVDYQQPNGFGAGGSYNYERYNGFHTSRSARPGEQAADPLARLDDGLERAGALLLLLRHAATLRTQHGGAVQLRHRRRARELRLWPRAREAR